MAGHSKWANIKHRKAAQDAKKGKILNKHSKLLMVLGKNDPNPETNATLRAAITNAKADGVPRDNIERILKKLSGADKDMAQYSEQVYEGFGPDGVPYMITALTDNNNRTFPAVRTAFAKGGGNLGSSGAVSFMFDHVGVILISNEGEGEDALFEKVIEAGAEDFLYGAGNDFDEAEEEAMTSEVITAFSDLGAVRDALEAIGVVVKKVEPQYRPKDPRVITDEVILEKLEKFEEKIHDVDDVDDIFVGYITSQ